MNGPLPWERFQPTGPAKPVRPTSQAWPAPTTGGTSPGAGGSGGGAAPVTPATGSGHGRHEAPETPSVVITNGGGIGAGGGGGGAKPTRSVAFPGTHWEASTASGKQIVIADAKSRSIRTLLIGLSTDLVAAALAALAQASDLDPGVGRTAWIGVGVLVGKSVAQAAISFVARIRLAPNVSVGDTQLALAPVPVPPTGQE